MVSVSFSGVISENKFISDKIPVILLYIDTNLTYISFIAPTSSTFDIILDIFCIRVNIFSLDLNQCLVVGLP